MKTDGYHLYQVEFVYRQSTYHYELRSTAKITSETNKIVARDLAFDAIDMAMNVIPNKKQGCKPRPVSISGEFGVLTFKD